MLDCIGPPVICPGPVYVGVMPAKATCKAADRASSLERLTIAICRECHHSAASRLGASSKPPTAPQEPPTVCFAHHTSLRECRTTKTRCAFMRVVRRALHLTMKVRHIPLTNGTSTNWTPQEQRNEDVGAPLEEHVS